MGSEPSVHLSVRLGLLVMIYSKLNRENKCLAGTIEVTAPS